MVATIAVVGNGPCEIGQGRGAEIDAHDRVIRFNNFTTDGFEADYGSKVTTWACNAFPDVAPRDVRQFSTVLVTTPCFDKRYIRAMPDASEHPFPDWRRVATMLRASPSVQIVPFDVACIRNHFWSAGFTVLAWLYYSRGSLDGVDVYGFSWFADAEHHYWQEHVPPPGATDHDGPNERAMYEQMREGIFHAD